MSKKKKVAAILAAVFVLAGASFWGYYTYTLGTAYPNVRFIERGDPESDLYYQRFFLAYALTDNPLLRSREADMERLAEWSHEQYDYLDELYEKGLPLNVKVSCEVDRGKTVFIYKGQITNEAGETEPFYREMFFNWIFASDEELSRLKAF